MPAAGYQAAMYGMACQFQVSMERLGIEAPAEIDDVVLQYFDATEFMYRLRGVVFEITILDGRAEDRVLDSYLLCSCETGTVN